MARSSSDTTASAKSARPLHRLHRLRRIGVNVVVLGIIIFLFSRQADHLAASLRTLRSADIGLVLLALGAYLLTIPAAASSYQALAIRPVRFVDTLLIQLASGFTNRLLPAGLGSLGLVAAFYHKRGHSLPVSSGLVTTNNLLGIASNLVLLIGVLLLHPDFLTKFHTNKPPLTVIFLLIILSSVVVLAVVLRPSLRRRAGCFLRTALATVRTSLRPGRRMLQALLGNIGITALNAAALSLAAAAAGVIIGWPAALLILSAGTLIGATVPTPGGIGGVEAGLLFGLLAFDVPTGSGLAAILIYRVLTYWLPIVPGAIAFHYAQKRLL